MKTQAAHDMIDALQRQLRQADLDAPVRHPWIPEDRDDILRMTKDCLGIRDEWIPTIAATEAPGLEQGAVAIHRLAGTSWPGCVCAAHLYLPRPAPVGKLPLVILCCGHGKGGKQSEGYRRMAWRLAERGCAVLVPDNIGQGERTPMGHRDVVGPFRCGLSLQGLIVMETIGWLRWAQADPRFDNGRIAAIGNSGGGTLTCFLGALCRDDLAALSSSGYPSSFAFIAAKEKKHCHCNILPGIVGRLHMWQLYGCFAPRPLFLFQGQLDALFPEDLFHVLARRVAHSYARRDASDAFRGQVFPGTHPWDDTRRDALPAFLTETLALDPSRPAGDFPEAVPENCLAVWPTAALDADALAAQLVGAPRRAHESLWAVYGEGLDDIPDTPFVRVNARQLAAQLVAFRGDATD